MKIKSIAIFAGVLALVTAGTTQAALESRLSGDAYYDTVLDITWLADANLAASNSFGLTYGANLGTHLSDTSGVSGIVNANGTMNWPGALHWIDAMNAFDSGTGYLGSNGWRLPTMLDTGTPGCNYSKSGGTDCGYNVQTGSASTILTEYSEMASLFYDTLGNLAYYDTAGNPDQSGWGLYNTGPFSNLQSDFYWSGLEYAPNTDGAWIFDFYDGYQDFDYKNLSDYAWAVQSGDVGAVPIPAAVWLFGSGLFGLIGAGRLRRR
ncbi:MAG: DUF1566 domain-containing protein [Gammaproteobacteria bacterium]|nr:DUF1566 domain-containing protein [Gammaproteobacteria bacterium]